MNTSTNLTDVTYLFTDGYNNTGYADSTRNSYTSNDINNDIGIYFDVESVGTSRNINVIAKTTRFEGRYIFTLFININVYVDTLTKDNHSGVNNPGLLAVNNISNGVWQLFSTVMNESINASVNKLTLSEKTILSNITITGDPSWITLGTNGIVLSDGQYGDAAVFGAGSTYIGKLLNTSTNLTDVTYLFTDGYNNTGYADSTRNSYTSNDINNDIGIYFDVESVGTSRNINVIAKTTRFEGRYIFTLFININVYVDTLTKDNHSGVNNPGLLAVNNISNGVWQLFSTVMNESINASVNKLTLSEKTILSNITITDALIEPEPEPEPESLKILFLHGGGSDGSSFENEVSDLKNELDNIGFTCVFLDAPEGISTIDTNYSYEGNGNWFKPIKSYDTNYNNLDNEIEWLNNYINEYGPFYAIVGYSMGASFLHMYLGLSQISGVNIQKALLFCGYEELFATGINDLIKTNIDYANGGKIDTTFNIPTFIYTSPEDSLFYRIGLDLLKYYSFDQTINLNNSSYRWYNSNSINSIYRESDSGHNVPNRNDIVFDEIIDFIKYNSEPEPEPESDSDSEKNY